ncbi:MAG: autotransporter-associated beta strand repeat-containing protein, partial [Kiritimatiellota bacterium]|nr:autotransporter-associated beta strand repeat-containing protein [Kiritimatiellota bacterium]
MDTTAVTGGTRIAGTVATTNTQMDLGATTLTAASSLTSGGGVINVASVVNGGFLLTVNAGAGASAIAGVVGGTGGLTKAGAGTLTLNGANTYTGVTTVNAGKVNIAADSGLGTAPGGVVATQITLGGGTLESSGTFTLNSNRGITLTADSTMDVDPAATLTYSGIITGAFALTKADTGTLALGGAITYTGATNINAGTLRVSNAAALGTGNVAHNTAGTLDIGSTTLNIGGTYTQAGAAILMVNVNGTTSGSIVSGGAATVPTTASLVLAVSNYVPNNTTYTIINGTGGAGVAAPAITVTGDNRATFTATTVGEDLILTASRAANGFASDATAGDSNASAVGTVLDNITNPSGD